MEGAPRAGDGPGTPEVSAADGGSGRGGRGADHAWPVVVVLTLKSTFDAVLSRNVSGPLQRKVRTSFPGSRRKSPL